MKLSVADHTLLVYSEQHCNTAHSVGLQWILFTLYSVYSADSVGALDIVHTVQCTLCTLCWCTVDMVNTVQCTLVQCTLCSLCWCTVHTVQCTHSAHSVGVLWTLCTQCILYSLRLCIGYYSHCTVYTLLILLVH